MTKRSQTDPVLFAKGIYDQLLAKYDPDSPEVKAAQESRPKRKKSSKSAAAVAQGKLGGRKGGLARAANLSPEKRKKIAKKAARARWAKKK